MLEQHLQRPSEESSAERVAPFIIRIQHLDVKPGGYFRPSALIGFGQGLRTSGFLHSLAPEELKNLLLLLSFITPNGECAPNLLQLSQAMQTSEGKARERMQRLARQMWRERPLVMETRLGNGLEAYAPSLGFLPVVEDNSHDIKETAPPLKAAPREEVIALSRERYGRPRAEVEREIAIQYGRTPIETVAAPAPMDGPKTQLKQRLVEAGVEGEQADALLSRYDLVRIERQLEWLPHRRVRNPAGFLLVAIKDNYEMPPTLRHKKPEAGPLGEDIPLELLPLPEDNAATESPASSKS